MGKGGGGVLGKKFPSEVLHPRYHITPLFPTLSKHGGGGAAGRMTVDKKSELVFLDYEKWELVFLKKTNILSYF